jgi:diguanylate cyclase (GGDEF)-like protein/PAS domain S-box-containing protein
MSELKGQRNRIASYAIYGFVLGFFFPLVATLSELYRYSLPFNWANIKALHLGQPLLLIIALAPIILSASFTLIGLQSARHLVTSKELDQRIQEQEDQIRNEHLFLEALINSTSFAIVQLDTEHHIITCNPAFEDLFGYNCDDIIGEHLDDIIAADELKVEASQISDQVSAGVLARKVSKRRHKNGDLIDVEIVGVPVTVGGENIGILGLYHDIRPRIKAEKALKESEARFRSLFDESPISLWEEDFSGVKKLLDQFGSEEQIITRLNEDDSLVLECVKAVKTLNVNQATLDLYNATSKEQFFEGLSQIFVEESLEEFRKELIALVKGETPYECEIFNRKMTGELIYGWLRLSLLPGYENSWGRVQVSIVDITERKEAEEKLRFMSFHDALTGLYNRAYFEEEMERLTGSRMYPISIIACDLDKLKLINDREGHDAGDRAIRAAANVLGKNTFRKEDIVARIGGDEFVVILPGVDLDQNSSILERIRKGIERHNRSKVKDNLYRPVSMSIGYAVVKEGESLEEGYKNADAAMYREKSVKKTSQGNSQQ